MNYLRQAGFPFAKAGGKPRRDWPRKTSLALTKLSVVFLGLVLSAAPVSAQNPECDQIRAQIATLDQSGGGRPNQYSAAAQRQQAELERTTSYARSLGCNGGQFSFFGGQPPAQCNALNARIGAMQANLGQLQTMAGRAGGGGFAQRQDLVARYNAYCRSQPRGFFESLFGNGNAAPQPEIPAAPPPTDDDQGSRGGSQAICVRSCDGGFFPLNYSARRGSLDTLQDLCNALCPNAEVSLFTRNPDNDVGTAVGADGTPYRDLANAFKFQKSFDASCSCKAKGESWVQALTQSDAEHVLGQERKGDILVTPEKSLELSRPKTDVVMKTKVLATDSGEKPSLSAQGATPPAAPGTAATKLNAAAADPSGMQEIVGPDGVKRRVRIVGPTP